MVNQTGNLVLLTELKMERSQRREFLQQTLRGLALRQGEVLSPYHYSKFNFVFNPSDGEKFKGREFHFNERERPMYSFLHSPSVAKVTPCSYTAEFESSFVS